VPGTARGLLSRCCRPPVFQHDSWILSVSYPLVPALLGATCLVLAAYASLVATAVAHTSMSAGKPCLQVARCTVFASSIIAVRSVLNVTAFSLSVLPGGAEAEATPWGEAWSPI
jgi:hypothetical protein